MIRLSRRQIGDADRVGGIELMILWPSELGPEPSMDPDTEDEAEPEEKALAESMIREACEANDLVPVHVRVACVKRPKPPPPLDAPDQYRVHLAVTIIGRRWVHASTRSRGRMTFARTDVAP